MLAWKLSSAKVLITYFLLNLCLLAARGSWIHQDTFSEGCSGWLVPGPDSTKAKHVFLMAPSGQELHQSRKRCLYWHTNTNGTCVCIEHSALILSILSGCWGMPAPGAMHRHAVEVSPEACVGHPGDAAAAPGSAWPVSFAFFFFHFFLPFPVLVPLRFTLIAAFDPFPKSFIINFAHFHNTLKTSPKEFYAVPKFSSTCTP